MAWADIYRRKDHASGYHEWRVYLGISCVSEDDPITAAIIDQIKPVLDLMEPEGMAGSWEHWAFSKEEYNAMMGGSDGSE